MEEMQVNGSKGERDMRVCCWCARNNRESCETECQQEGKYRHLEPVPLEYWETGPELPAFSELVALPPALRLALLYLMAYYSDYRDRRE